MSLNNANRRKSPVIEPLSNDQLARLSGRFAIETAGYPNRFR
jgi:hypothetical protein